MTYTASKAQAGRGVLLSIGSVSGATLSTSWTVIGEIKNPGIKGSKVNTVDTSNTQSGIFKEFLATMMDPGSLSLTGNRVSNDAGQIAVEAAYASLLKYDWKVQYPINVQAGQSTAGDFYTFSALVESRDFPVETEGLAGYELGLKISGAITPTLGS